MKKFILTLLLSGIFLVGTAFEARGCEVGSEEDRPISAAELVAATIEGEDDDDPDYIPPAGEAGEMYDTWEGGGDHYDAEEAYDARQTVYMPHDAPGMPEEAFSGQEAAAVVAQHLDPYEINGRESGRLTRGERGGWRRTRNRETRAKDTNSCSGPQVAQAEAARSLERATSRQGEVLAAIPYMAPPPVAANVVTGDPAVVVDEDDRSSAGSKGCCSRLACVPLMQVSDEIREKKAHATDQEKDSLEDLNSQLLKILEKLEGETGSFLNSLRQYRTPQHCTPRSDHKKPLISLSKEIESCLKLAALKVQTKRQIFEERQRHLRSIDDLDRSVSKLPTAFVRQDALKRKDPQ